MLFFKFQTHDSELSVKNFLDSTFQQSKGLFFISLYGIWSLCINIQYKMLTASQAENEKRYSWT